MKEKINSPQDLKKLSLKQLEDYASEVREFLVQTVSEHGGHLASNLGVVELTIALHYVFQTPEDKIIWDVGHQSYVHKMITGRREAFSSLRQLGGLSGFPKASESEHDSFNTGHSSTSISVAAGMSYAHTLQGKREHVIAVIGDGSFTGGMAFEAMNDSGHRNSNMIVILNDNTMSISKNVGALSGHLNTLRTAKGYNRLKRGLLSRLEGRQRGDQISKRLRRVRDRVRSLLVPDTIFDKFGYKYIGVIDGHDIEKLVRILKRVKRLDGRFLIHVRTIKGKGYEPAEAKPQNYHGVSRFDVESGKPIYKREKDYSAVFGAGLVRLAERDPSIVAITAAMPAGTGLKEFSQKFPPRFFDVGIAEQHAVTMAAGMAKEGLRPVVAVYSTFAQRAYDQILHDVALQNLHVVLCLDRAGVVGEDGETHQGVFDLSYLTQMPNIAVLAPSTFLQLEEMLFFALYRHKGPIAIRYPRGGEARGISHREKIQLGRGELVRFGKQMVIFAIGRMVSIALAVSDQLEKAGISAAVVDLKWAKPLDTALILEQTKDRDMVVTMEDNVETGGIGQQIRCLLYEKGIAMPHKLVAFPTEAICHGKVSQLLQLYRMDADSVAEDILRERDAWKNNG